MSMAQTTEYSVEEMIFCSYWMDEELDRFSISRTDMETYSLNYRYYLEKEDLLGLVKELISKTIHKREWQKVFDTNTATPEERVARSTFCSRLFYDFETRFIIERKLRPERIGRSEIID
jgi:hypothetical protein